MHQILYSPNNTNTSDNAHTSYNTPEFSSNLIDEEASGDDQIPTENVTNTKIELKRQLIVLSIVLYILFTVSMIWMSRYNNTASDRNTIKSVSIIENKIPNREDWLGKLEPKNPNNNQHNVFTTNKETLGPKIPCPWAPGHHGNLCNDQEWIGYYYPNQHSDEISDEEGSGENTLNI